MLPLGVTQMVRPESLYCHCQVGQGSCAQFDFQQYRLYTTSSGFAQAQGSLQRVKSLSQYIHTCLQYFQRSSLKACSKVSSSLTDLTR